MSDHPHLTVQMIVAGSELFPEYCLLEHEGWSVNGLTNSLILGQGLPRKHIPLSNVVEFSLVPAPHTCANSGEPTLEQLAGYSSEVGYVDEQGPYEQMDGPSQPWLDMQWPDPGQAQHTP